MASAVPQEEDGQEESGIIPSLEVEYDCKKNTWKTETL